MEEILNQHYRYTSGAQWLGSNILRDKWVLAVAGTHGKTTTSAMLTWILEYADLNPSYLIGGVVNDFAVSARLTDSLFFVIEADEYDTAFFDKRSKFVHYHPNTLVINNLEFDHADIFDALADIQKQFHHLVRLVPNNGLIIYPKDNDNIDAVIKQGCWSSTQLNKMPELITHQNGSDIKINDDLSLSWSLIGKHNANNAISALMAARHAGVPLSIGVEALEKFKGVKRRLEVIYQTQQLTIYDDFAHHPTAIATTLEALRQQVGNQSIMALVELRSNTMKQGFHQQTLIDALACANSSVLFVGQTSTKQQLEKLIPSDKTIICVDNQDALLKQVLNFEGHLVIMSNGAFGHIHQTIIKMQS